ncbi:hypothetical protein HPB49_004942 [Dermacentor silvarum]|uniref:Uncharacterized protein n=1 Tax=Dermacentor silvarum TaxID=543639 RepID=A0ACB8DUH6_DERSI|nr:hypothetical protein HPB49_004942 [Dermacentor silvarum]
MLGAVSNLFDTDSTLVKRAQDVGRVTTEVLSSLYEPFVSVRSVILRQASEVCSCKYFGDVRRFKTHFLLPVAHLLRLVKTEAPVGTAQVPLVTKLKHESAEALTPSLRFPPSSGGSPDVERAETVHQALLLVEAFH